MTLTASTDIEGLVKRLEEIARLLSLIPECAGEVSTIHEAATALRALDEARKGAVVKPLEWNEYETEGEADRWDAQTVMGAYYEIDIDFNGYLVSHDYAHLNRAYDTLDEAKAAAQADFDRRIRSALLPSLPARQEDGP